MVETPFTNPVCLPGRHRQRMVAIVFGLMILGFGIIIGAGGMFLNLKGRLIIIPPGFDPKQVVADMKGKYGLTEQQEKKLHALFEEQARVMGEVFRSVGEKQKENWAKIVAGMKNILDEKQFADWENDVKKSRRQWDRERGPRPGGPGRTGPEGRGGPDYRSGPDRGDGRRGGQRPSTDDRIPQGPPPDGQFQPPTGPGSMTPPGGSMPPPPGGEKPFEPSAPAGSVTETPKPSSPDVPVQQPPAEPKPQ